MSESSARDLEPTRPLPQREGGAPPSAPGRRAEPESISGLVIRRVLGEYVTALGHDWPALLRAARLNSLDIADVDARLSLDDERRLWREAERVTRDPEIGLHAGAKVRPAALDALGYVMRSAPTLRDALAAAVRFHRFVISGAEVNLECNGGQCAFSLELLPPLVAESRHPVECAFAALVRLGREATQSDWSPRAVSFQHPRPIASPDAASFFRARIEYGSRRSMLCIREKDLDLPIQTRDGDLCAILERHLGDVLARLPEEAPFLARLRRDFATALGRESVGLRATARRLGMGPRTLQRRLREHDVSFRDVLDGVRRELGCAYVRQGRFDCAEIGSLLGFARPSAFHRAFRRWTGGTPNEYRTRHCHAE
jgi:AraC-like DNA-binding protein